LRWYLLICEKTVIQVDKLKKKKKKGKEKKKSISPLSIELGSSASQADTNTTDYATHVERLILLLISFSVTSDHARVFPGKICLDRRKNHGCGQKRY